MFNNILDVDSSLQVGNLQELADVLQVCGVLAKGFQGNRKAQALVAATANWLDESVWQWLRAFH